MKISMLRIGCAVSLFCPFLCFQSFSLEILPHFELKLFSTSKTGRVTLFLFIYVNSNPHIFFWAVRPSLTLWKLHFSKCSISLPGETAVYIDKVEKSITLSVLGVEKSFLGQNGVEFEVKMIENIKMGKTMKLRTLCATYLFSSWNLKNLVFCLQIYQKVHIWFCA